MVMHMSLVDVGRHDELVPAAGKLHGKLIADPVGFFRRDLSRIESLADMIGDHIFSVLWLPPSDHLILLLGEQEIHLG